MPFFPLKKLRTRQLHTFLNAIAFPLPTVWFVAYYVSNINYQSLRDDNMNPWGEALGGREENLFILFFDNQPKQCLTRI